MTRTRTRNRVNYRKAVTVHYGVHDADKICYIGAVTYYNVQTPAQAIRRFFCEHRENQRKFMPMYVRESKVR